MSDREFLEWIRDRLVHVYGESPNVDFVQRLEKIAGQSQEPSTTLERYGLQWNGPDKFVATPMADGYWTPWHIANQAWQAAQAQAGERKCSECGNGEPDLSLYCVRCLNNDHWHLIDPDQAGDGEAVGWLVMIDGDYKFFESYDDALDARKHEEYWNKGIEHAAPRPVYAAPPAAVNHHGCCKCSVSETTGWTQQAVCNVCNLVVKGVRLKPAVNQQLLEALKACEQCLTFIHGGEPLRTDIPLQLARAAIAAAQETGK